MNRFYLFFLMLLIPLLLGSQAYGQNPGDNDPSFNPDDTGFGEIDGFNGTVRDMVRLADGKILAVGTFTAYNGTSRSGIARINVDGTLDTSFDPGTGFTSLPSFGNLVVNTIAIQGDGKIVVGGVFARFNGLALNRIARLNPDGTYDTDFNPGSGFNGGVDRIALQVDGKILVGGTFTSYNGTARNRFVRIEPNGNLDTSLDVGTGFNNGVISIAIQPDNKILLGGSFTSFNGVTQNRITRLNLDGSRDTDFNTGTGVSTGSFVWRITLQPDNKILVGGEYTRFNGLTRNSLFDLTPMEVWTMILILVQASMTKLDPFKYWQMEKSW
ncbi:MAG: delta-60 repeat domain-containing protein [Microscillaceae bacterium]|nr:delta-60 repeat domain-containing protein [Microscillaceae bacterium]